MASRARRVKCDEQRPSCQRCVNTGRVCPGYVEAAPTRPGIKIYNIPFRVPGSRADRELLHFYCCEAAGRLSRFSSTDLWTCLVLQRSQHSPVIRNSLVTLSCLYRDYIQSGSSQLEASPKHIQLIARSHKQLRNHLLSKDASPEAALICSLMFYVFECLVGNAQQAIWHLDRGLALLQWYWTNYPDLMQDSIFIQIASVFSQLDIHASVFSYERMPILDLTTPDQISGATTVVPESFTSLTHAEETMVILQNWVLRHLMQYVDYKQKPHDKIPKHVKHERINLESEFQHFESVMEGLASDETKSHTQPQQERIMLLQTQALVFHGVLLENAVFSADAHATNAYNIYDVALNKAATLLELSPHAAKKLIAGREFTLSTNLIAILYFICMKTTDRRILHRSLSSLQDSLYTARDGLWDASAAVQMVRAMLPEDALVMSEESELEIKLEDIGAGIVDATGGLDEAYKTLQVAQKAFDDASPEIAIAWDTCT